MRVKMGVLSTNLSMVVEDAIDIQQDWNEMFPTPSAPVEQEEEAQQ